MDTPDSQRRALKTGSAPFPQNGATCLVKCYIQQYEDSGTKEKGHENSKGLNIFYIDNLCLSILNNTLLLVTYRMR